MTPHPALRLVARALAAVAVLGLTVAGQAHAQAQATTGVIRGTVTDSAGQPILGATVVLRNLETNAVVTLSTNTRGAYVGSLLRVGNYEASARAVGYQAAKRDGIVLRLGEAVPVDFQLAGSAVQLAEITVTTTEPLVDVERTTSATRLDPEVIAGLPNNGRNFLNFTLLTPNVGIVQGPDGDVLSIGGQRGIHNNVSVDGADFNNPFFGEQRGGQRPAFTFNLDAVQDIVVVSQGANAEFGRSGGGFVNVITKSGTNQMKGSLHYFGKYDALSKQFATSKSDLFAGFDPDFAQHQFGFTLGGPIKRDKAFFFMAYDQQVFRETRQKNRLSLIDPALRSWVDTAYGGALQGDFGSIRRTNDANAFLAKIDVRLSDKHNASLKYNYTNSRQENGTFDVDLWGRSANGLERDYSHAVNGSLLSQLSSSVSNEFRFQFAREDRPRPYEGPDNPRTNRPFPDTDISFTGFRIGMPFFLPITAHDTRVQVLNNVTLVSGNHLFKFGAEWNRTEANQTFLGFANGRMAFSSVQGFLNYARFGNGYVECSNNTTSTIGACPPGSDITGPVVLYLQAAGVGDISIREAGTQSIPQHELALFIQDSWKPSSNFTLDYGIRWEAQVQPDPITPPSEVFFAPFIGQTVTNSTGTYTFPSDGTIPSSWGMFQPRLGMAWDINDDGRQVLRASAGLYYARVPGLNLAGTRSTNGSRGQNLFRNSELIPILGRPPVYGELLPSPTGGPFQPGVTVFDKDFQNPRTFSATIGYERELGGGFAGSISYTHARTDHLTRFVNRNSGDFGQPWATGLPGGNGLGDLTVVESSAKSRYNGATVSVKKNRGDVEFQVNYTLSFDKSDDDNERDPFTFRYARANDFGPEYNYSDRDQRHRLNAWVLAKLPGDIYLNNRLSAYSNQPTSLSCGPWAENLNATPAGQRAGAPLDRTCPNGPTIVRNTIRKRNAFFSWDMRISRPFTVGNGLVEAVIEVFNLTNADNFKDPSGVGLFLNFDGTIRTGISEPRQIQTGLRYAF